MGSEMCIRDSYGTSEDLALQTDVAMGLWFEMNSPHVGEATSNWILFERGYSYDDVDRLITNGIDGESELHPLHITAWGEGERPVIENEVFFGNNESENIVISDLHFTGGIRSGTGSNVIFHDIEVSEDSINILSLIHI